MEIACEFLTNTTHTRLHTHTHTHAHIPLVASSRHSVSCREERVAFVVSAVPCLFQHGGRRRSSSVPMYKFSLLCSGFARISGTSGKVRWTWPAQSTLWGRPWTRVVRVALVVTSVSRRAVWQARHSTSRLFPVPKCMGQTACRVVMWHVTQQVEFGLYHTED